MIKAILFDLDNTLIDFIRMKKAASNAAASAMIKNGLRMDEKTAKKELFNFYLHHGIESSDAFTKFLKKYNFYNDRIIAVAINAYHKSKFSNLKPYPGVKKTLKKLKEKGLKLAIVTDAPKIKAYQRLDYMGIINLFDVVVGFEDTKKTKPSKLPFKKALRLLKIKPSEAIYVGDHPERDIKGAKKLGIKTCLAKYGWCFGKYIKPDYEIKRIEELLKIIREDKKESGK